jgi:creatinine amidohydrolase/Fe(II)-dependent formamide hydrolase-like protein
VNAAALTPAGRPIRARGFAVVDEAAFEGSTLPGGYIREDPRTATPALGEKHLTVAVDAIVEALGGKVTGQA